MSQTQPEQEAENPEQAEPTAPEIPCTMEENFLPAPEPAAQPEPEPDLELDVDAIIAEILREIDSNVQ